MNHSFDIKKIADSSLLNIFIYLFFFIEIASGIGAWAGGMLLGRYFAFWSIAFALLIIHTKSYKNSYLGISTLFAYLSYLTEWDYYLFDLLMKFDLPFSTNNTVITLLAIFVAAYSIFSFFILKKKSFPKMFSMVLITGLLSSMTLFHVLTIEYGSKNYREYKMEQFRAASFNEDSLISYCKTTKMSCYIGKHSEIPNDIGTPLLYEELLPKTKDLDYEYTWLETDFIQLSMTYFYIKRGDIVIFGEDKDQFMILMEYFSMIFTILMLAFTFTWTFGCLYLIKRHPSY